MEMKMLLLHDNKGFLHSLYIFWQYTIYFIMITLSLLCVKSESVMKK